MNLTKLFDTQRILDERIIKEKGLEGRDVLPEKILALQVELGELANEWRGFKFWSEDREPRTTGVCSQCSGYGEGYFSGKGWTGDKEMCVHCSGFGSDDSENPLLEEYVDCLHFILSIALEYKSDNMMDNREPYSYMNRETVINQFADVFHQIGSISYRYEESFGSTHDEIHELFSSFYYLGDLLGFTWEQIESAYFEKNKINHSRQDNGY